MSFEQDGFAGHTKLFFRLQKHDSHRLKMIARNLTLDHLSNRCTLLLPVVTVSYVPIAVSRESQDRSFADMVRGAKADLQIAGPFSLTQLAPVQRELSFEVSQKISSSPPERSFQPLIQCEHTQGPDS